MERYYNLMHSSSSSDMADILMLEPDAVLAATFRQALEAKGHSVRCIVSAQNGIFQVDERCPDVIITELQLVAHSGIEFLYELRSYSEWQDIPVIVHSSVPPYEFEGSGGLLRERLNVRTYLYKPHTSLASLIREVGSIAAGPQAAAAVEAATEAPGLRPSLSAA